jgi:hypothetical protein
MAIIVRCSACGQSYRVSDHFVEKRVRCKCGQAIEIPFPTPPIEASVEELLQAAETGPSAAQAFSPPGIGNALAEQRLDTSRSWRWLALGGLSVLVLVLVLTALWLLVETKTPALGSADGLATVPSAAAAPNTLPTQPSPRAADGAAEPAVKSSLTPSQKTVSSDPQSPTATTIAGAKPAPKGVEPPLAGNAGEPSPGTIEAEVAAAVKRREFTFRQVLEIKEEARKTVAVALSADGSRAVTCTSRGECQSWDVDSGKPIAKYDDDRVRGDGGEHTLAVTPDGRYALVSGAKSAVYVWDASSGKHVFTHDAPKARVTHLQVTPDGGHMAAVDASGALNSYPTLGGQGHRVGLRSKQPYRFFAFDPRGLNVVLGPIDEATMLLCGFPDAGRRFSATPMNFKGVSPISAALSQRCGVFGGEDGEIAVTAAPMAPGEEHRVRAIKSRLDRQPLVQFTGDGETILAMDLDGRLEYRPVLALNQMIGCRIQPRRVTVVSPSLDGKTVAYGHDDGFSVWRVSEVPTRASRRFGELVNRLFLQAQYDKLESIAQYLRKERMPFSWQSRGSRFDLMIEYLSEPPGTFGDSEGHDVRIRAWVSARPASLVAKLVQAQRLVDLAWKARGSGFADTVTEEGWKVFREDIEKARGILEPIADSDRPPAEVFSLLFAVAKAQSWDADRVDKYVEKLMKTAPRYAAAHAQVAIMRMPRWGGKKEDSQAYARSVADRIGGAAGDGVYARAAIALRPYHDTTTFLTQTFFDPERLHSGIAQLAKEAPDDPLPLHEGLIFARMQDDRTLGRIYAEKLGPFDEEWPLHLWRSREAYDAIKRWAESN